MKDALLQVKDLEIIYKTDEETVHAVNGIRLQQAEIQLRTTDRQITQIALDTEPDGLIVFLRNVSAASGRARAISLEDNDDSSSSSSPPPLACNNDETGARLHCGRLLFPLLSTFLSWIMKKLQPVKSSVLKNEDRVFS